MTAQITSFSEREKLLIRKRRAFSPHKWVAMGTDAEGPWVEVFYSSRFEHEAVRQLERLTEGRHRCCVTSLERA